MKKELVKIAGKAYSWGIRQMPRILTGFGVTGLFVTTGLACKATWEAKEKLNELPEDATTMDKVKAVGPCYIPVAVSLVATGACIICAISESERRQAVIATAYSMSETAAKEFQDKAAEVVGEKKVQKIKDDICHDKFIAKPVDDSMVINTGRGDTLFLDAWSGRYFKGDIELIRKTINDLNADLINGHYVTLQDFYYAIGLPNVQMGEEFGWNMQSTGPIDIEFSAQMTDDQKQSCIVLNYCVYPTFDYACSSR